MQQRRRASPPASGKAPHELKPRVKGSVFPAAVALPWSTATKADIPLPAVVDPRVKDKAFVDFQNDVHLRDIGLAVREGYSHVELAKRYTTTGMPRTRQALGTSMRSG